MDDVTANIAQLKDALERKLLGLISVKLKSGELNLDETSELSKFVLAKLEPVNTIPQLHEVLLVMNHLYPKMSTELDPLVQKLNQNIVESITSKLPDLADKNELDQIYALAVKR